MYDVTHLAYENLVVVLMSVVAQSFCRVRHSVLLVIHAVLTSNAKSTKSSILKKTLTTYCTNLRGVFILLHHHNLIHIFVIYTIGSCVSFWIF